MKFINYPIKYYDANDKVPTFKCNNEEIKPVGTVIIFEGEEYVFDKKLEKIINKDSELVASIFTEVDEKNIPLTVLARTYIPFGIFNGDEREIKYYEAGSYFDITDSDFVYSSGQTEGHFSRFRLDDKVSTAIDNKITEIKSLCQENTTVSLKEAVNKVLELKEFIKIAKPFASDVPVMSLGFYVDRQKVIDNKFEIIKNFVDKNIAVHNKIYSFEKDKQILNCDEKENENKNNIEQNVQDDIDNIENNFNDNSEVE